MMAQGKEFCLVCWTNLNTWLEVCRQCPWKKILLRTFKQAKGSLFDCLGAFSFVFFLFKFSSCFLWDFSLMLDSRLFCSVFPFFFLLRLLLFYFIFLYFDNVDASNNEPSAVCRTHERTTTNEKKKQIYALVYYHHYNRDTHTYAHIQRQKSACPRCLSSVFCRL